jgi:hypothetical protein
MRHWSAFSLKSVMFDILLERQWSSRPPWQHPLTENMKKDSIWKVIARMDQDLKVDGSQKREGKKKE